MRGRRRVGKSRLAEEFISATGLPNFSFMATGGTPAQDLTGFAEDLRLSSLPGAAEINEAAPTSWDAAFRLLAGPLPEASASIVVLDEVPSLAAADPSFEGALQRAFDRSFSRRPVMLILIGSNTAVMEQLSTHGRHFSQRGTELVVPPLSPADVATLLELDAADAVDAYLVTGGLPLALEEWPVGGGLWDYLASSLHRPTSALIVNGERVLAAELPVEARARLVLQAIGHGERTLSLIGRSAGDMPTATLVRAVHLLTGRRMAAADLPLSTSPSKLTRYRIADPALRFWLTFVQPAMPVIERGRGDLVLDQIRQRWSGWRGRAVQPVVRDALVRLADVHLPPGTREIGGYWTRTNDPEIDLVGADRGPVPSASPAWDP